jgi:hypothetical protein
VTDPVKNRKANIAHLKAVDEGIQPDTQEYFDYCETELGLKEAKPNEKPTRTKAMAAAPVSREGGPITSGKLSPTQVTLTPGEQQRAMDGTLIWNISDAKTGAVKGEPIGLKEFARRKQIMEKEGRYDRSYTDQ